MESGSTKVGNNCGLHPYEHDRHPYEDGDGYVMMCNGKPNK
jgi:hypothetical protein